MSKLVLYIEGHKHAEEKLILPGFAKASTFERSVKKQNFLNKKISELRSAYQTEMFEKNYVVFYYP